MIYEWIISSKNRVRAWNENDFYGKNCVLINIKMSSLYMYMGCKLHEINT